MERFGIRSDAWRTAYFLDSPPFKIWVYFIHFIRDYVILFLFLKLASR